MIGLILIKWNVLKANFLFSWNTHCDISPFKAPNNTCLKKKKGNHVFTGPQTIALKKGHHVLYGASNNCLNKRQPCFYRASNNCLNKRQPCSYEASNNHLKKKATTFLPNLKQLPKKKKKSDHVFTGPFLCLSLKSEGDLMPLGSQGMGVIEFIYKGGKVKVHLVFSQNRV